MPRDATETRSRLLREAERLFATRGIYRTTTREILDAAGQRNVSALSYHFGSRAGVLREILVRHGNPLDEERGELVARIGEDGGTRALVAALLIPLAGRLATPEGRDYLRIVAQMTEEFPAWRVETELHPAPAAPHPRPARDGAGVGGAGGASRAGRPHHHAA